MQHLGPVRTSFYFLLPIFSWLWVVCVLVTQSCPTLCNPMDYSQSGSSVHEILQARILEWVATPFSRRSSIPRDQTQVSCTVGRFFTMWAPREVQAWVTLSCFTACLLILKNCTLKKIYCNFGSWLFFHMWRLLLSIYLFILVICLD